MTSTTVTVLVGVGGILLGALTSGAVQVWLAARERERSGRAAANLLFTYLAWARAMVDDALTNRAWNAKTDWNRFIDPWVEQRIALARLLPTDDFRDVAIAFGVIEQLAVISANDRAYPAPGAFTSNPESERTYRSDIEKALRIIHRTAVGGGASGDDLALPILPSERPTSTPESADGEQGVELPSSDTAPTDGAAPKDG
jgi:hypothetical protein